MFDQETVTCMPNLTHNQSRLKDWLQHPLLQHYAVCWDFSRREVDLKNVAAALESLSHAQALILQFLVGVWMGEDHLNFDFFTAVLILDKPHLDIIRA